MSSESDNHIVHRGQKRSFDDMQASDDATAAAQDGNGSDALADEQPSSDVVTPTAQKIPKILNDDSVDLQQQQQSTAARELSEHECKTGRRNDPKNSSSPYAYVFLVIKGDRYIKGALAGAFSIKRTKSPHDCVCMVTEDISDQAIEMLRRVFDRVLFVDYIQQKTARFRGQKQQSMYESWTDCSYTKWRVLELVEYRKVLFMDADAMCLKNCDHLFEMHAPAATFSRREAAPFADSYGLHNPYGDPQHGDTIRCRTVKQAIENGDFVIIATSVLLQPNAEHFQHYMDMIRRDEVYNARNKYSVSGADEISLSQLYVELGLRWTYISQIYNWIPWNKYGDWLRGTPYTQDDIHVVHFFGVEKPWEMDKQKSREWKDLTIFFESTDEMLAKDDTLKDWWDRTYEEHRRRVAAEQASQPAQHQSMQQTKRNWRK